MLIKILPLLFSLSSVDDSTWDQFVQEATTRHGEAGGQAARFLAENRPPRDGDLDLELLRENLELALRARREFSWAREVPDERFLNDVLPYAVLDETRERWRPMLLELAIPLVADCESAGEAAQALNRGIFNAINVHYNTGRKRANQSPRESIAQGRATCTGLSIILVDACRSVGIPARAAGVASWHDKRGNHTWVEIHDGESWRFTGADEFDSKGLDRGWFAGDAAKAQPGDPTFGVWASSWAASGGVFPMVWSPKDRSVPGVDVTERYVPTAPDSAEATAKRFVRVWNTRGGERVVAILNLLDGAGEVLQQETTRAGRADMNDMPGLGLQAAETFELRVTVGKSAARYLSLRAATGGEETLDLYWDELALTEAEAESLVLQEFAARRVELREERAAELGEQLVRAGGQEMSYLRKDFGAAPQSGHSLWISMHGGGGAPKAVNDRQWKNQIGLYTLDEGVYIAPRAPTDTWNLWHEAHIDDLLDRLIETLVVTEGVDPNRVYLMGYSAGGDGVYQLAPRMADRFAAASMMAGHPNDASPLGLRNLPFAIFMGGDDGAYNRNAVAARWGAALDALEATDPEGYPHRCTIYEGLGHWMEGKDAEALPWMARYTRDPWPSRVVWHQAARTHGRFYWLALGGEERRGGAQLEATVAGQTIALESEGLRAVTLRLRDSLVDLDEELVVTAKGEEIFRGRVPRSLAAIRSSLAERCDASSAATALLELSW